MKSLKKIFRNIIAVICLLIGFIGGFIPVLQGWVFVLLGFILLDFKKKEVIETKILSLLSKTKIGSKLVGLWNSVKKNNKDAIQEGNENIKELYKKIKKSE